MLAVDNSVEMKVGMKAVRLVEKVVGDWAVALVDWKVALMGGNLVFRTVDGRVASKAASSVVLTVVYWVDSSVACLAGC